MLTNSAKLLKKFLAALMLTSALCLASCGVTRTSTTSQRTHSNSATTATTDSVGATTSATHDLIKAQADVKAELTKEQTDSTQTVGQSTAHVKTKAQSSQAANSESATQAKTKRSSWRLWAVLTLVTSVLITVCAFYLRRKIKFNKQ